MTSTLEDHHPAARLRAVMESAATDDGTLPPLDGELLRAMALPDDLPETLGIAEVAELTGITAHTLRYYERIGLVTVDRDAAGRRAYDRAALGRVMFVTWLRLSGMPIASVGRYVELALEGPHTSDRRLAMLLEHREAVVAHLRELQTALAVVDYKITTYGGSCAG
ncbi:MerR family transcriptional regulator [Actinomycetospora termitidis]|uniref:MerR family transcriptional regulator n=1 Tax=Actinomycetospora termitidis TaxID=3053470 RepID=A0ABT7MFT4_9PSEU|nr:MerR family transcriptional regulator [Actinomycetospora sp. Odt1-22]MDL5158832.1 MerR family transcriptional regulator [Actinomycetospora sp. Odt1-22]